MPIVNILYSETKEAGDLSFLVDMINLSCCILVMINKHNRFNDILCRKMYASIMGEGSIKGNIIYKKYV